MGSSKEHTRSWLRWSVGTVIGVVLAFAAISLADVPQAHADDMFKKGADGQYEIETSVWFPSNAKRFRPRYRSRLKKIAGFLKKHPEISLVQLVGHADSRGNVALNARLSGVRARYVKDTLVGLGVDVDRLQVLSSGAEESSYNNKNPRGRAMNRRVDFVLVYGDVPAGDAVAEAAPEEPAEESPDDATEEPAEGEESAEADPQEEGEAEGEQEVAEAAEGEEAEAAAEEATEEGAEEATEEPAEEPAEEAGEETPAEELVEELPVEPMVVEAPPERVDLPSWLDFLEPYVNVAVRSDVSDWVRDNPEWIAAGVTSAALLTAVTLDAMSISKAVGSDDLVAGTPGAVNNASAHADYRNGALIFYAIAAAGAAGSTWLYLDDYMSLIQPEAETSIQLVPTEGGAMLNLQVPLSGD